MQGPKISSRFKKDAWFPSQKGEKKNSVGQKRGRSLEDEKTCTGARGGGKRFLLEGEEKKERFLLGGHRKDLVPRE